MTADCPQHFTPVGFTVQVTGAITFVANGGGKMSARCEEGEGRIVLEAGGAVTIAALGIDAGASANDRPAGTVRVLAEGTVQVLADVTANALGGAAQGGTIEIEAEDDIAVQAPLQVKGYGGGVNEMPGGEITLRAGGDVRITAGAGLNAESFQGGGGEITIRAGGLVDVDRPLHARGTGVTTGAGGSIQLDGEQIALDNDAIAIGGQEGGDVSLEARAGGITVGTASAATLDVTGNGDATAGAVVIRALGSHVTLGGGATVTATGASGATGGRVHVAGVNVTTNGGTRIVANGAAPDRGGVIEVEARGALALAGTIQANNQGSLTFLYRDGTPSIGSGITGYDLVQIPTLPAPCGDGIRLGGAEACDQSDLGGETCASQGHGSGTLGCAADCTFDFSGCSGP